jgi:hypothetical protein
MMYLVLYLKVRLDSGSDWFLQKIGRWLYHHIYLVAAAPQMPGFISWLLS